MKVTPFLLRPAGKDYLWGGNRLKDDFSKEIDMFPLAETWECSTHPDGLAVVAGGRHSGQTLKEVLIQHPEYMGKHARSDGELPVLVKFIDAKEKLSVQVHPSDEYAMEKENGQLGKTEMWYVLDAAKDSNIIYGFSLDVTEHMVREAVTNGSIEKFLQKIPVKKDDVFLIQAGTVHAVGEGVLIAEIQENSNLTYRLYDYNRIDKNGVARPLNLDKATAVANMRAADVPRQPMRLLKYRRGIASELLCRCKYFQTERILVNTERCRSMAIVPVIRETFQILLCVKGCGVIFCGGMEAISFFGGDCIFVPANCENRLKVHGKATLLRISC